MPALICSRLQLSEARIREVGLTKWKWDYAPAPETVPVKIEPRYELFINGRFVAPDSGKYFDSINPATEEKLTAIALADEQDVDAAVKPFRSKATSLRKHLVCQLAGWFFLVTLAPWIPLARGQALELDPDFKPFITRNFTRVYSTALQADQKILIGGDFIQVGSVTAFKLARLNTDGTVDPTFGASLGFQGGVLLIIVVQGDGKILVGGRFTHINGVSRNRIARLNSDGSLDSSFTVAAGPSDVVTSIGLQSDGKIIIAGDFLSVNGVSRSRVARLHTDGNLDLSFDPGTGVSDPAFGATVIVSELVVQSDGKVVLGGKFTLVSGVSRSGIARLNADGSLDTSFAPSSGVTGSSATVSALALQSDGRIVIGGSFTRVNGTSRTNIARLTTTGGTDSFVLSNGTDLRVFAAAMQNDDKVLIGGEFATAGGQARNRIARLTTTGAIDTTFDPGSGPRGTVTCILVQPNQQILLGNLANAAGRYMIERLESGGVQDSFFAADAGLNAGIVNAAVLPYVSSEPACDEPV